MLHPEILPLEIQLLSLLVQGLFLLWVVRLIRTHRLSLRDSLLWLFTTAAAMAITAFPRLLVMAARLVGVQVPANAVFGVGLLYVAFNVLAVTISASGTASRVRRLTQECALLRAELEDLRSKVDGGARRP